MAELGNLFRCLAGIDWTLSQATATWCPTDDLRVYSGWLDDAIELAGAGRGAEWVLQPR